ncbi:MAG: site-specific tyrosine recombinase XerC [Desulforhopalus sp.]|jgi:integrase/recombinase XerD|nr:site-specific tyrosine recombinase XerC [Desulforhopalus sp.]
MPRKGEILPKAQVGDPTDPEGFAVLREAYLESLRVQNYSERTVENRISYLNALIIWCEERSLTRPSEITKPILERYQRHLLHTKKRDGKPLSFRAQHARLIPVRQFFKWLCRQNLLLSNPASDLLLPRLEKRLPKHVQSAREVESILNQPDVTESMGVRDRAILEVFYSTGIRRSELAHLQLFDVDAERGTVMVRLGKGKKDRMIPIGERAIRWIERYTEDVRPGLVGEVEDGTLFLTNLGEAFSPNRLTQMVRGYVKAADLGKSGSCHLFRHACATLMLENGADIRFIQAMLGHAKLETTEIYTHVSIRQLKAIHESTHPARMHSQAAQKLQAELEEISGEERTGLMHDPL